MRRYGARRAIAACLLALAAACKADDKPKGALLVSFESDMALPQQVDTMHVSVLVRGQYLLDQNYPLGTQVDHPLPATLVLQAGDNPGVPVTVRVAGRKQSTWRTYREFTSTIPAARTALVRMPLQWLCDEMATTTDEENSTGQREERATSTCGDDNTCRAGQCVPSLIDEAAFPDFEPGDVFGGSDDPLHGECFDVVECMAVGSIVTADGDCTVPMPKNRDSMDPTQVNVALRVTNGGVCDPTQTMCFVPLNGDDPEGFQFAGDRLKLPPAACTKQKQGLVNAIYTSGACSTKKASNPPCGTWSSVPDAQAITPDSTAMRNGGASGGGASVLPPPAPTPIGQLMGSVPCCSLSSDAGQLYACVCDPSNPGNANIDTVATAGVFSSGRMVTTLTPPTANSMRPFFAAQVAGGNLFWVNGQLLQRTPLSSNDMALSSQAKGALYSQTSLLTDENAVYALASGVEGAPSDAAVQIIVFGLDTKPVRVIDTRGNAVVYQFSQDHDWLYVVSDVDTLQSGNIWERESTLVRVPKLGGAPENVMPGMMLTTADKSHGGYVGVQVAGTHVFALYENQAAADGTFDVELQTVDSQDLASTPKRLYKWPTVDPAHTRLVLLGAIDGAVILSRVELEDDASPRSSTVLSVAANGGSPRILADFANDLQALGIASDADHFYWINGTRRIYALPRSAVQ